MLYEEMIILNRYKLQSLIGYGGMGEVWEAIDNQLVRDVALKIVHPHLIDREPEALKIFFDEARLGAKLIGHPNIVITLDFIKFEDNGKTFHCLIMENVPGISLQTWITDFSEKLDTETYHNINLLIAFRICEAIQFAHRKKIQHRDIKPLNIFLSKYGGIKVGDFGIARFVEAVTRTHTIWHAMSPAYAAPEQWKGNKPTLKTDIYQLGCTLFQLFAKRLPFDFDSGPALMNAHLNEEPLKAKDIEGHVSESLSDAIYEAMEKKQKDRITLWQLHDILSKEVMKTFDIEMDLTKSNQKVRKIAYEITEFEIAWIKSKPINYTYHDYDEALSEAIELAMNGIIDFKIKKRKK